MKKLAFLLLLAACGDHSGSDPAIVGHWISQINATCVFGANFDGSDYSLLATCADGSTYDTQAEGGTYTAMNGQLDTTALKATCPGTQKHGHATYSATSTSLTLTDGSTATVFQRNDSGGGSSGTLTYGCFDSGAFTPSPFADVM